MESPPLVLLTGASGYVGGRLLAAMERHSPRLRGFLDLLVGGSACGAGDGIRNGSASEIPWISTAWSDAKPIGS